MRLLLSGQIIWTQLRGHGVWIPHLNKHCCDVWWLLSMWNAKWGGQVAKWHEHVKRVKQIKSGSLLNHWIKSCLRKKMGNHAWCAVAVFELGIALFEIPSCLEWAILISGLTRLKWSGHMMWLLQKMCSLSTSSEEKAQALAALLKASCGSFWSSSERDWCWVNNA